VSELRHLALELIDPPLAAIRVHIPDEATDELAESIRTLGLLEPLIVEPIADRYRVIAGHRRYLACRRAPLPIVPCVVLLDATELTQAVQIHENIMRLDMTPAEEARLFRQLYDELDQDIEKVAGRVRLGAGYVDDRIALTFGDPLILDALDKGEISIGVAQALNSVPHEAWRRERLDVAIRGGCTVSLARRWAAELRSLAGIQKPAGEQKPEAPAETTYIPIATSVSCWFCEGNHDLHLLRVIQVHDSCIRAMDAMLKKIGREA
jgi:ParB family chromosome partitioning protein